MLLALLAFRMTRVGGGSRTTTNVDRGLGMLNRPHKPSRVLQRERRRRDTRNPKPETWHPFAMNLAQLAQPPCVGRRAGHQPESTRRYRAAP